MPKSSHEHGGPLGVTLAPLFLRAALAITFIWAGLGKVIPTMTVDAPQAALLASMGVAIPSATPPLGNPAGSTAAQPAADAAPTQPIPPQSAPAARPTDSPVAPTPSERAANPNPIPTPTSNPTPATAPPPTPAAASAVPPSTATPPEVSVRRVYGLALRLHSAANPGTNESGEPQTKLWPSFLGSGNWPRYFAWAVVFAELGGGILIAIGLLTRIGAFLLIGVMLGAIWLDQIGPAIQAGNTALLILPAHNPWDVVAWRPLLWQFSLLCAAAALLLLGAGAPSLDRALGWGTRRRDDDEL